MNIFLYVTLIVYLLCVIHGARRGMITIIYGIAAWAFLFWFISFGKPVISDAIYDNTQIAVTINEKITENLSKKYYDSEVETPGTGMVAMTKSLPKIVTDGITEEISNSVQSVIVFVANELTGLAVNGISIVVTLIAGYVIVFLGSKLVRMIGGLPLLRGPNMVLGIAAGVLEASLIIWIIMYVADFFPTTTFGVFVIGNSTSSEFLKVLYENNIIKMILG